MSVKKILLRTSMAIAVLAFAIPIAAAAEDYVIYDAKNKETITEHTEGKLFGTMEFETLGTGIRCNVDVTLTTEDGSAETTVPIFNYTTQTCEFFGFLFEGCILLKTEITNTYEAEISEGSVIIIGGEIHASEFENCTVKYVNLLFGELPIILDDSEGITHAEINDVEGAAELDEIGTLPAVANGTFQVGGGDAGTFGTETVN